MGEGPARLKPCGGAPSRSLLILPPLEPCPALGRFQYALHIGGLGILLEFEYLILAHHLSGLHGVLEIAHTGQSIISIVVPVPNEPAALIERRQQLRAGGVLQLPGVEGIEPLEAPELGALDHVVGHLPKQSVHIAETLGGVVQADVIVTAGQDGIQEQRVYVGLKIPAVSAPFWGLAPKISAGPARPGCLNLIVNSPRRRKSQKILDN